MVALVLTEEELAEAIAKVGSSSLGTKLLVAQEKMLKRKEGELKNIEEDENLKGYKLYAVALDAFDVAFGGYCAGKTADEACEAAGETLAQTNFGDWNSDAVEVTQ